MNGAAGLPDEAAVPPRPLGGAPALPYRAPAGAGLGPARRLAAAPWRWAKRRTLRGRLIAGLLILLALACAVVGGATYFAVNRFLLIQLDDQLQASARIYAAACQHHDDGGLPGVIPGGGDPDGGALGSPGCGTFPGQAVNTLDVSVQNGVLTSHYLVNGECRSHRGGTGRAGWPARPTGSPTPWTCPRWAVTTG